MAQIDLEDWLTLSVVDTPASLSRLQVQTEKDRKMTATSGLRCYELSKVQGQGSSLEKMLLVTSPWVSMMCYLTWKPKATPQGRLLFQLVPKMRDTDETGSGLWATPNTMDHLPQRSAEATEKMMQGHRKGRKRPSNLREQVNPEVMQMWRTPQAANATQGPKSAKHYKQCQQTGESAITLVDQVRHTPKLWPTPTTQDAKNNGGQSQHERNSKPLNAEVGGSLNPEFCEWLMGYPIGWTELEV